MDTPIILKFSHYSRTCLWRWNRQSVPKWRHIKFRRRGITQKKTYNIQNMAKVWNQEMGTGFPSQFSALIYPFFHSSNQSFAMIHIAVAFHIYLPRWWRQHLPVDHFYTSSPHHMALRSTRWQSQNLHFHECNRNCGVFLGWCLHDVAQVNRHFRDCIISIITVVILLIELCQNRNKGDAVGLKTVGLPELPDSAVFPRGF
jgi:hypothetical protein